MKKIFIILLMFSIITGLYGCSSLEIGSFENNSFKQMEASYYQLNGTKEGKITVKDNETVEVSVSIVTKSGSIDVFIFKDKEAYEYEGHYLKTQKFKVTLSDPGTYTIQVKAKKHKGSYSFTW